jgi:hypothetical protein
MPKKNDNEIYGAIMCILKNYVIIRWEKKSFTWYPLNNALFDVDR